MKVQTPSDLARLIKNARVRRNLTQQDIADAVGITRQSLARVERGNGGTSFDTVLLILDHLGVHLNATTDRDTTAPAAVAPWDAAQAAVDALNRRITPRIDSRALAIPGSVLSGQSRAEGDFRATAEPQEGGPDSTEGLS
ncbi:transcriptional regulator with XRE-family HTH domain [Microbacteriaceae bacterium SG_E_30_P1]|uniref:Transcriptional regulator with XRE-family HTH domain n=1 Tax=Antiquaquibacter oligotrophicus TaxID=2880260 RepID=A0ABT6KQT3_9MICO|nr:helix-turn-helix transcriptional regulator [Antiquaquibacter oligotrophicus]MDH6182171.1 transcriptional regulator with XRE-family HTH domain [Antiquaquibacter oligotrophicus]UDF12167.1 helix-turn-helix transcriptional regulator [Antiquaquibacter oligotrophicus]